MPWKDGRWDLEFKKTKGYLLMLLMVVVLVLLLRRQQTKLKRVWEGKVSHGRKRNDCARHVGCQNIPEKVVHIEFLSPRCTRTLLHALKGHLLQGQGFSCPGTIVHGLWRVYGM